MIAVYRLASKKKVLRVGFLGCIKIIPRKPWFFVEEEIKTERVHKKLLIYMRASLTLAE
jgi:hypothetical protein